MRSITARRSSSEFVGSAAGTPDGLDWPRPVFDAGDDAKAEFAGRLRDDLAPVGVLESFLADRVISAAWCLFGADGRPGRAVERDLQFALSALVDARALRRPTWGVAAARPALGGVEGVEAEAFESDFDFAIDDAPRGRPSRARTVSDVEPVAEVDDDGDDVSALWRDRLELNPEVCASSPVVRGTRLTVREVVSRIVDGWSWADLMATHAGLTEADLRACMAYCSEEEGGAGF